MGIVGSAPNAMTITLDSLAHGAGRASLGVDNSDATIPPTGGEFNVAIIYVLLKSGAVAPSPRGKCDVYLLRADEGTPEHADDGWDKTDSAFTLENASPLKTLNVRATADKDFEASFSTEGLGPLGPIWGIAVVNRSGEALATTGSGVRYVLTHPDASTAV